MAHVVEYSSPESSMRHERREIGGGGGGGRDLLTKRHRRRRLFHDDNDDDDGSVVSSIIHSHVRRVRRRIDTGHGIKEEEEEASEDSTTATTTPRKPSEHSFVVSPTIAATATTLQPTTTQTPTTQTRTVIRLVVGGGTFSLTLHPRIRGRQSNDSNRFCMASSTCCVAVAAVTVVNVTPPPQRRPRPPWQRSAEVRYGDAAAWCDYHCLDEDAAAYVPMDDASVREWVTWIVTSLLDPAMAQLLPRVAPLAVVVTSTASDSFQRVLDEWRRIVVATLLALVGGYVRPRFHDIRLAATTTAIYGVVWNYGVRPALIAWISAAATTTTPEMAADEAVAAATTAVDIFSPYTHGWLDHVQKNSRRGPSDGPPTTYSLDYMARVHEDLCEWESARACVTRLGELGAFLAEAAAATVARRGLSQEDPWTDVARDLSRDTGGFRDEAEERDSCPATQRSIRAAAAQVDDDEGGPCRTVNVCV